MMAGERQRCVCVKVLRRQGGGGEGGEGGEAGLVK